MQTLRQLKEGDPFVFPNKPNTLYYVEGQYPRFHCTTVCKLSNIEQCKDGGLHATMVTGVDDRQLVAVRRAKRIHICHKVNFLM